MKHLNPYLSITALALLAVACVKDQQPEMLSDYFFGDGQRTPVTYEQYLGTWRVGSRVLVLEEYLRGVSYKLTDEGFGPQADKYHPIVRFESGKGTIAFCFDSWTRSQEWETCYVGLSGNDVLEGEDATGGLLARGKLSADANSFTITAVPFTADGKKYQASSLALLVYHLVSTSEYDKGWYTYKECQSLSLPATAKR